MSDPELRRLFQEASRAGERLVSRIESYGGELTPERPTEAALSTEIAAFALFVERRFRDLSERARDVREMCEEAPAWGAQLRKLRGSEPEADET